MTDTDTPHPDDQPYHAIIRAAVLDGCIDSTADLDAYRIIQYLRTSGYMIVPVPDGDCAATRACGRFACDTHGEELINAVRTAALALDHRHSRHALPGSPPMMLTLEEPGPFGADRPPRVRIDNCRYCPPLCCDGHTLSPSADGGWTL